jgi:hypothetical protein
MARQSALRSMTFRDLTGGRNGSDDPLSLPPNQCSEFLNCDWKDTTFAHKRGGATSLSTSGGTAFSSGIQSLFRYVPGASETAAELFGVDGAATPLIKRLTGGTTFADVTLDDAIATKPQDVQAVSFNGKLFLAYDSTQDRLHVYDPNLSSARVRRVGFSTPAAPTAANTGAGAWSATVRYYRVRWVQMSGSVLVRQSEAGPSVSFTPSGTGFATRITQPTPPGEGETHWQVEVSLDNATWLYRTIERLAIGATTHDDNNAITTFTLLSDVAGLHVPPTSWKYLASDGNRLLGLGSWETGGTNSTVYYTPVLGTLDHGDDERIPNTTSQKNRVPCGESDGDAGTGLGVIDGVPYVFKYRRGIWKLRPTGDVAAPYLPKKIRDDIGCISHKTIALGKDHAGNAALYFYSHLGPFRIVQVDGFHRVQYLGRDNQDVWRSANLAASTVVAHSVFIPDLHQWWLYLATGASNDPDVKMMLDVRYAFPDETGEIRGGWAKHTGDSCSARCSVLFSNTVGASMSRDLKPYIGRASGTTILKCDTTDADDNGTDFQGTLTTRPVITADDLLQNIGIGESQLVATAGANTSVSVTINRDFDAETRSQSVSIAAAGTETRVIRKVEGSEMGEAKVVQMTVGDSAANEAKWTVHALTTPVVSQEAR